MKRVAVWSRVGTPALGQGNQLSAVAMLSARNVWAVGGFQFPVVVHWDGHRWKRVRVPKLPSGDTGALSAIDASSPANIWAVGLDPSGAAQAGAGTARTAHRGTRQPSRRQAEPYRHERGSGGGGAGRVGPAVATRPDGREDVPWP